MDSCHFYTRNNASIYRMDILELREAIVGVDHLTERLRQLHVAATDLAHRSELPFELSPDPAAIVSVMPLDVFRARRDLAVTVADSVQAYLPGLGSRDWNVILEGVVWNAGLASVCSFALTHRQGHVDAFWTIGGERVLNPQESMRLVFPDNFEAELLDMFTATQAQLQQHGVDVPWIVMGSLIGIAGAQLSLDCQVLRCMEKIIVTITVTLISGDKAGSLSVP